MYKEVKGNLITMALNGNFDVIAHGCNCMCTQKSGIAPQMVKAFGTDKFPLEARQYKGRINKLGQIQSCNYFKDEENNLIADIDGWIMPEDYILSVVNAYTQFNYGKNHSDGDAAPVDYEAITLCMRKINHQFKGKHIGLPKIGAGLAGGDWDRIKAIFQKELTDCNVTVVIYDK